MADRIGQRFGNYRLIRLLGWGGFAEVYQGEHVYLKSYAAIKVLHTHLVKDDIDAFLLDTRVCPRKRGRKAPFPCREPAGGSDCFVKSPPAGPQQPNPINRTD